MILGGMLVCVDAVCKVYLTDMHEGDNKATYENKMGELQECICMVMQCNFDQVIG